MAHLLQRTLVILVLGLLQLKAAGQVRISGTVYDRSARIGVAGVSVKSTSGAGAITDSSGRYSIKLPVGDSITFSYQGKATMKYPVSEIPVNRPFDVSLHVKIQVLPTVEVSAMRRSYQQDSMQYRDEYRKIFDFAPDLVTVSGTGAGLNLNTLFNMKKIKRMESFRQYLEQVEREKYVDYRFNKQLVRKITGLQSPALDTFMMQYRPTYEMLQLFESEYQYYEYIKDRSRLFSERREHRDAFFRQ